MEQKWTFFHNMATGKLIYPENDNLSNQLYFLTIWNGWRPIVIQASFNMGDPEFRSNEYYGGYISEQVIDDAIIIAWMPIIKPEPFQYDVVVGGIQYGA